MAKRKKAKDENQIAAGIIAQLGKIAKDSPTKNPAAVALGRLGGLKGGKARDKKLSPERKKEISAKAIKARWDKYRAEQKKISDRIDKGR